MLTIKAAAISAKKIYDGLSPQLFTDFPRDVLKEGKICL